MLIAGAKEIYEMRGQTDDVHVNVCFGRNSIIIFIASCLFVDHSAILCLLWLLRIFWKERNEEQNETKKKKIWNIKRSFVVLFQHAIITLE